MKQMTMSPSVFVAILLLALVSRHRRHQPASPASATTAPLWRLLRYPRATATQFLQVHNDARRAVGVAPLAWNSTLEEDAKRYAGRLGIRCKLEPLKWDTEQIYGQNTYWGSGFNDGAAVAGTWVYERRWYDHGTDSCAPGKTCGTYRQVVWNTTRQLGCARRTCRSSPDTIGVCRYFPAGNAVGIPPY